MQSAGRPASSYYDPEGETIYLSPTPAPKGPEKARRRPELNDVFGYVGSATLLVAHSSGRKSILRRLRLRRVPTPSMRVIDEGRRYLFVANQILRKHPVVVDCMNLFGSACVGFNCYCKKAYAPMFLEICWFGIAFAAMVKHSI